jgi:hypothetical protein
LAAADVAALAAADIYKGLIIYPEAFALFSDS